MAGAELTEAMITAAMAEADVRVRVPGDHRCYPFPSNIDAARDVYTARLATTCLTQVCTWRWQKKAAQPPKSSTLGAVP
jgi:hypothetical protein